MKRSCKVWLFFIVASFLVAPAILLAGNRVEFRENKGQWDPEIRYRAEISGGYILLTENGITYLFYEVPFLKEFDHVLGAGNQRTTPHPLSSEYRANFHAVKIEFLERSPVSTFRPQKKQDQYYNYFIGNDPEKWASQVGAWEEIVYEEVYPGVDFIFYSSDGSLKYDLVVKPGADPGKIKFKYTGANRLLHNYQALEVTTSLRTLYENEPFVYQLAGRDTLTVPCSYSLEEDILSFDITGNYDKNKKLVIDPLLVFSTYSGSTADNWGNTATFDRYGNVYSGGTVRHDLGGELPVTAGAYQRTFGGIWDIALLKFDSTGQHLMYGTYFGGSGSETPFSMIVNDKDELVVYGITGSGNMPVTRNAYSGTFSGGDTVIWALPGVDYLNGSDFFIARFNKSGSSLLASTFLGGSENEGINSAPVAPLSRNYGDEFRGEVITDKENNIYIVGNTSSRDFPIRNGYQQQFGGGTHDAVIAKLDPDLTELEWSTYVGGSDMDAGYGIKVVEDHFVVVAGGTKSNDFPVRGNAYRTTFGGDVDGFITKLSARGDSLLASTYVGTVEYDQIYFVDIDSDFEIYVYGQTSGNYPVSMDIYSNPNSGQFIHKFSNDLSESIFSTVVGSGSGQPDISPTAFLVNECENIFLSGWGGRVNQFLPKYIGGSTFSMPVTGDAFQKSTDGSDFYLMVLATDAKSLLYATYLGAVTGAQGEHVDGGTSRFDKRGIVYHAICACRDNSNFPTTPGVWSRSNNSLNGCNNGVFKFDLASLSAAFTTDTWEFDHPGISRGCYPLEVVFLNKSVGGKLFQWDFGDGSDKVVQDDSVYHIFENPGSYNVLLYAIDENTCQQIDVARKVISVFEPNFTVPEDTVICEGDVIPLLASGASIYEWEPAESLDNPSAAAPNARPDTTTTYYLYMVDQNTCELLDSVRVEVIPEIQVSFSAEILYDCKSLPKVFLHNNSQNADRYTWDLGDGNQSTEDSLVYSYAKSGNYRIELTASSHILCVAKDETQIHISDIYVPNIITPNKDGKNETFTIITDAPVELKIFNRWGKKLYHAQNYQNNWEAGNLGTGTYYYEMILNHTVTCNGWIQVLK